MNRLFQFLVSFFHIFETEHLQRSLSFSLAADQLINVPETTGIDQTHLKIQTIHNNQRVCVCVCVCVCVRNTDDPLQPERVCVCVSNTDDPLQSEWVCVCVCVCVKYRQSTTIRERVCVCVCVYDKYR